MWEKIPLLITNIAILGHKLSHEFPWQDKYVIFDQRQTINPGKLYEFMVIWQTQFSSTEFIWEIYCYWSYFKRIIMFIRKCKYIFVYLTIQQKGKGIISFWTVISPPHLPSANSCNTFLYNLFYLNPTGCKTDLYPTATDS